MATVQKLETSKSGPSAAAARFVFRALAVLIGLMPFLVLESVLRVTDWGNATELEDPYVGFSALRPLFVLDEDGQRYEIDPARHQYFRPESFAASKDENEFRIFCLGGSTVQGRPYAIETSFTTWLELSLRAADPRREWEVVNCGGISYASYRLVPILRELLDHEPDLFILYTGHNEFLEDRTYRKVKNTPAAIRTLHSLSMRLRTYRLFRAACLRVRPSDRPKAAPQNELPAEVDALLDYRDGLADYHRNDDWRRGGVAHYRLNLSRMIALAESAGVPVLLVNPISNLRDCPPFKLEVNPELDEAERAEFETAWEQARTYDGHDLEPQIELVRRALALDDRHAGAHFLLAKCFDGLGRFDEASAAYLRAKDEDICPLRMIGPLHSALFEVARSTNTPLVDARLRIEQECRQGIPGDGWLLDHVHPSINGHQLIADSLVDEMTTLRLVQPRTGWRDEQKERYAQHLEALPDLYFAQGRQRLDGLIRWTRGRANKLKSGGIAPPE